MAETICHIGTRRPVLRAPADVKGTAGTVAIMSDEVMRASAAYEWTLNHTIEVDDPMELFLTRPRDGPRLNAHQKLENAQ